MDPAQTGNKKIIAPEKDPQKLHLSSELEYVTEEMYKKNAELSLTNKTLSVLQKINSIILSSVTDLKQVSGHVVDVIVSEAGFQRVSIYILKGAGLEKLAASNSEAVSRAEYLVKRQFPSQNISLANKDNLFVKVVSARKLMITANYREVLTPDFTLEEASLIQRTMNVRTILVYPLIVRDDTIGIISIGMAEDASQISVYVQDLMNRLADIIGIAIDSSLLYQRIEQANSRLKDLDQLKDEFVSIASHELRTPMTAIKSYVWLMLHGNIGDLSDKQKSYLERTYVSTERLIKLVNDMLNISRIESGRLIITSVMVDANKIVSEVLMEVQARALECGITLVFEKPGKTYIMYADPDKIKQVLINLIGNSINFTPKGGSITVLLSADPQFVTVSVKDTGQGIKKEDMEKLFKKFNMLGGTLTREKGQGTGLGLYLSKSLIELQGGKIWAESGGANQGSVFNFTLPVAPSVLISNGLLHSPNPRV